MEEKDMEQLALAVTHIDRGQLDAGVGILRRLQAAYPDHPVILGTLGAVALQKSEFGEAEVLLDEALEREPGFYPALVNKGILLVNLGDPEGAIPLYTRALELNPRYAEALSNRGNALALLDRTEEALRDYDAAISMRPGFADAHYNRAFTLARMGRLDEAQDELELTVTLNPTHRSALELKLSLHEERGETTRAEVTRKMLQRLIRSTAAD